MAGFSSTLRLVWLTAFASMASARICDPMLLVLSREFDVSAGEAGAVVSWFAIAYGGMQLLYGPLGDRYGKLRVIVFAAFACSFFSLLTALAPTFGLLALARAGMGATAAGIVPMAMAWIGDQVPYDKRQETIARLTSATVSGLMMGQWFGGVAADSLGWRAAFFVLTGLFFVAAWRLHRSIGTQRAPQPAQAPVDGAAYALKALQLLRLPRVRWVLTMTLVEGALAFGSIAFAPSLLTQNFGLSASASGAMMILYGIGGLCYSQLAGRWISRLGERGLAFVGGALIALGLLLLTWASQVWLGALACIVAGLGFYMLHSNLQVQATQMAPEARATAVTLFACTLFFGQSIGVVVLGLSLDWGLSVYAFSTAAVTMLILGWKVSQRVNQNKI